MDTVVFSVPIRFRLVVCACLTLLAPGSGAAPRVPNTTLVLPSSPPQSGFATAPALGGLTFTDPIVIATPPGETNRLFIAEQAGIVAVVTNLAAPTRSVFLNISSQVTTAGDNELGFLGFAFHPNYASNGHFFVYYSSANLRTTNLNGSVNTGLHQCLARFTVSTNTPNAANPASELKLLVMPDNGVNHNGGCLQFGPDGCLYVSTGDEGGQNDQFNNSQMITNDFWSGLLRIDVDLKPGSLMPITNAAHRFTGWGGVINYRIPTNNPFVGATNFNGSPINTNMLRAEFWAVGLRNPWRFSFDSLTGALYVGDVGGGLWEEINVITPGGNYGWAYREGFVNGPKSAQAPGGFSSIPPIIAYGHGSGTNEGFAVIGGVVYRGSRFPSIDGKYIFADNASGRIWATQPNGTNVVPFELLATDTGISTFGFDPRNGDVLMADQNDGVIKTFTTATNLSAPPTLADTGAFSDVATLTPNAGILPYEVNVPFWSDNATKQRWFSVPDTNLTMTFSTEGNWLFPTGSVWIKHFDLETNTITHETRRLETRLLVRYTNGVYGLTYRWTLPPTNALLIAEEGLDESIVINDNGTPRTQVWHYPGRGECLSCHSTAGGGTLGFGTLQLNRAGTNGGIPNQIQTLSDAGYFNAPVGDVNSLRAFAHPTNEAASLEWRARSYLAANCSACHQPGGTIGSWDGRFSTPTRFANVIHGIPYNTFGNPSNRIILPGSTNFSLIHARMSTRGPGGMPPLASTLVDTNGAALLARWINTDLTNYQSYAEWQVANFGGTNAANSGELEDYDGDSAKNYLEYLTGTDPLLAADGWGLLISKSNGTATVSWEQPANRAVELQTASSPVPTANWQPVTAPFNEPFYPSSNRVQQFSVSTNPWIPLFYRARVSEP